MTDKATPAPPHTTQAVAAASALMKAYQGELTGFHVDTQGNRVYSPTKIARVSDMARFIDKEAGIPDLLRQNEELKAALKELLRTSAMVSFDECPVGSDADAYSKALAEAERVLGTK